MQKFLDNHFKKNDFYYYDGLKYAVTFKVVDEGITLFSPKDMFGVIKSGFTKEESQNKNRKYRLANMGMIASENDFTFEIMNTKLKHIYALYNNSKLIFKADTRKEATDYANKHGYPPDYIYKDIEAYGKFI
jgi:hypothetical protein